MHHAVVGGAERDQVALAVIASAGVAVDVVEVEPEATGAARDRALHAVPVEDGAAPGGGNGAGQGAPALAGLHVDHLGVTRGFRHDVVVHLRVEPLGVAAVRARPAAPRGSARP